MARLTETQWDSTYNDAAGGSFPDNVVRAIIEATMRQFADDSKDSFVFAYVPESSAAATLTLTTYGPKIHTGTGATWTLPAGSALLDGKPFVFAHKGASGQVTINNSSAVTQIILDAGMVFDGFWDNTNSQWIIY